MSEYVSLPTIGGLLDGFVGDAGDLLAVTFPEDRSLIDFQPALNDAPSGGTVVLELRTATGGGGSGMQATIPDGAFSPATPASGGPISLNAGDSLYLRVVSTTAPAGGLYGVFVMDSFVGAGSGVTAQLTTDSRVLEYDSRLSAVASGTRTSVISSVSDLMARWIGRQLNQAEVTEWHETGGHEDTVVLDEWPADISAATITENGEAVALTDVRLEGERRLVRLSGGDRSRWARGEVAVTYQAGYAAVPDALVQAATKQVAAELWRVHAHLIGVSQREPQTGPTETFDPDGFLPSVRQAMAAFRRIV